MSDSLTQAVDVLLGELARSVTSLTDEQVREVVDQAKAEFSFRPINVESAEEIVQRIRELAEGYPSTNPPYKH